MSQYNFSTLNDKELEVLVRDLLTKEFSIPFQSFKTGKDKGIDLRYSTTSSENKIIVQVKHYLKSGYSQLLYVLKNDEKDKVQKLNPERYILVTSIGLSPTDKEKIKDALNPYILSTNDIFGADDLNGLIAKYESIEKKHFKLWFSNVNIIQKIVTNGIDGRSSFIEEKIKKNTGIYVVNQAYEKAIDILRNQKILLITGIPGVGKTTLANLITYRLLSNDFRLVYIDEKVREAEDMFDNDVNVKQLFYFDDFLGSNYLEIVNSRNTDKSIVNFIERVKSTKNKYLILTTRSTILNQARSTHEKLSRANLDSLKYEIEIKAYSDYDKAKILYNHLYFNDLDFEFINEIFKNKNYWRIIEHDNYNPRLIEYFTKEQNISHLKTNEYFDFIISNLDNPEEIWDSALRNQLNTSEKYFLFTLLSLGRRTSKGNLEKAFDSKIEYEVINHGFTREVNIFNISLRNLMDGYITNTVLHHRWSNNYIDFINPSLRDYLISFFNTNNSEKWRLIESFIFVEQFLLIFSTRDVAKNKIIIENNEIRKFLEIAYSKDLVSIYSGNTGSVRLRLIGLIDSFRINHNDDLIDKLIINCLNEIEWRKLDFFFLNDILPVIEKDDLNSSLYEYFKTNWDIIIEKFFEIANTDNDLERIKNIFEKVEIDYKDYKNEDENWKDTIVNVVNRIFKVEADEIFERTENEIYSISDFESMEEEIYTRYNELSSSYLNEDEVEPDYNPCDNINKDSLIEENKTAQADADADADAYKEEWKFRENEKYDSVAKIDDLFSVIEK